MCGGTFRPVPSGRAEKGLSPRVRGNRGSRRGHRGRGRSIPACAGEPQPRQIRGSGGEVYPRVCGGTSPSYGSEVTIRGLSPRVRGNPADTAPQGFAAGSIPACAGEPPVSAAPPPSPPVYPRVCGGTAILHTAGQTAWPGAGLSPRVRGNRHAGRKYQCQQGSIPACAGEPRELSREICSPRVYPRVCGGTGSTTTPPAQSRGLSPRVRGNPVLSPVLRKPHGSIPACAGEPFLIITYSSNREVYPRVCGGTHCAAAPASLPGGLSPRVRGNRGAHPAPDGLGRSIPACAGEPWAWRWDCWSAAVYPRVCGGTRLGRLLREHFHGLSPRVRGNPLRRAGPPDSLGSIPACAGEPGRGGRRHRRGGVYPRVCGGT